MISVSLNPTISKKPIADSVDFKSSSVSHKSKPIAISLRKSVRKQKILPRFEIEFFDFDYKFAFDIVEIEGDLSSGEIVLYLKFSGNIIQITLSGEWCDNEGLHINDYGFGIEKSGKTPIDVFLINTLWAMLNLSAKVKINIPDFKQEATMSFDMNVNEISEFLQTGQIAYRLMVIEKTFKIKLPFPKFVDGKEVENIAFCYHAVVEREFDWLCNNLTFFPLSTNEYADLLPPTNSSFPLTFPTQDENRYIFGHLLNLKQLIVEVAQAIVVNYEEARQKMLALSGESVEVIIKSVTGKMRYKTINTPTLPKNAFSREIQKLIDLEEQLDSVCFEKYLDSFSNAFEDLTDEQVQAVTERPILEEEAFNF